MSSRPGRLAGPSEIGRLSSRASQWLRLRRRCRPRRRFSRRSIMAPALANGGAGALRAQAGRRALQGRRELASTAFLLLAEQAFRERLVAGNGDALDDVPLRLDAAQHLFPERELLLVRRRLVLVAQDRKSTRLNSSHVKISYA